MTPETRRRILLAELVESPETVIWMHVLKRGNCEVYLSDESDRPVAAILQARDLAAEPTGFGSDPQAIWQLLALIRGWQCILVDEPVAPELGRTIEHTMKTSVRYLDDIYHVPSQRIQLFEDYRVRLLTPEDIPMLEEASPDLRPVGFWSDVTNSIKHGIGAGAIVDKRVVAIAFVAALGERYADIGVYTLESHRELGLATAAASFVGRSVQDRGLVPVWGCGEHNLPSLKLARKLGFVETSRRTYVVIERYLQEVSRRTYPVP